MNSMTGYGGAQGQIDGIIYTVEIRTVNNRYFKAALKLPDIVAFLESDIEAFLREELSRGSVSYVLKLKNVSANVLFDIDEEALRAYAEKLSHITAAFDNKFPVDISNLIAIPGIIRPVMPDDEQAENIKNNIITTTEKALKQLKQMRAVEGKAMLADLEKYCDVIRQDLDNIENRSAIVVEEYQKKLKKRVDELLAEVKLKLDETTLGREVAIFADRSDISEEIARLDSHLGQFKKICRSADEVGRRLEFIGQEMLREANTIASKASDTEIAHCVVDMKCQIEKIKEQVQNVE